MNYLAAIQKFDGKRVDGLKTCCESEPPTTALVDDLLAICAEGEQRDQVAATWMLKCYWEQGYQFNATQSRKLLGLLNSMEGWEPILHGLQMIEGLQIDARQAASAWKTCRNWQGDDNKLVRAWALHAVCHIAKQHKKFLAEATALCEKAAEDPSAAVRARARKLSRGLSQKSKRDKSG